MTIKAMTWAVTVAVTWTLMMTPPVMIRPTYHRVLRSQRTVTAVTRTPFMTVTTRTRTPMTITAMTWTVTVAVTWTLMMTPPVMIRPTYHRVLRSQRTVTAVTAVTRTLMTVTAMIQTLMTVTAMIQTLMTVTA